MINLILLKKELYSLRLGIALVLVIQIIDIVYRCFLGFPDRPEPSSNDGSDAVFGIVAYSLIMGIVLGIAMIGQEREHHTLAFLDGLPVGRLSIFAHKAFAAFLIAFLIQVFLEAYDFSFELLIRDSLSEPIDFLQRVASFATQFLLTISVLGGVVFLSFSRKWFPLLLGIALSLLVWIETRGGPLSVWLNTRALVLPDTVDGEIVWPIKQMIGHAFLGGCCWILAAVAFLHRDGRLTQMMDRYSSLPVSGYLTVVGYGLAAIVWFGLMGYLANNTSDDSDDRPVVERAAGEDVPTEFLGSPSRLKVDSFDGFKTNHFQVIFRKSSQKIVSSLKDSMDPVHQEVIDFFQNPTPVRGRIVVDCEAATPSHAAGVTNWTKVRVPLAKSSSPFDFLQVLRHEVGHVYINKLSDGKATEYFNALRVFHEGVATAVQLSPQDEETAVERLKMERWAAVVDSRGRVPLSVLCDDQVMRQTRDENIVYPLGYLVSQSLIEIAGPSMPRRMLESARALNMPVRYRSSQLWSTLLQQNGASIEMLSAAYEARLDALREREAEFLKGLPRLSSNVTVESGEIVVRVAPVEGASESAQMICMFEKSGTLVYELHSIPRAEDGTFRLPRDQISGSRMRYLVGWLTPEASHPIFEPWSEAKLAAN